ncbi:936_t:CDS:1, partial [Ambispora gerdemannii]
MDLNSNAYFKLSSSDHSELYERIQNALSLLEEKHDHETPEMWCSRIRDPFRKILEENPGIFSKNGYT